MVLPDNSSRPSQTLHEVLRGRRTAALIADAELIRNVPTGSDRNEEANRYVREAMLLFALRKITREERDRILDILSFAIPHIPPSLQDPYDSAIDSPVPNEPLARNAQ